MRVYQFSTEEDWLEARRGRITGTTAKEVTPKSHGEGYRAGFYQLIADRIALPAGEENAMDRGKRLEDEALERFAKETGKKVKHTLWTLCERDDEPAIAYSPDGLIGETEDVETKCRGSATHIEAFLTQKIPSEYEAQIIQGFVVNDKLKTRYLVFYDPRCPRDFFYLTIKRSDMQKRVDEYLEFECEALKKIAEIEKQLTF